MGFNISRTIIYILTALVFVSVFFFAGTSHANACVVNQATIRTSADSGNRVDLSLSNPNWYSDDNQPFVYLDVKTTGCEDESFLSIRLVSLKTTNIMGAFIPLLNLIQLKNIGDIEVVLASSVYPESDMQNGEFTFTYRAGETLCYSNQNPDCMYLFFIAKGWGDSFEILRIIGNIASRLSPQDSATFFQNVAQGFNFPAEPDFSTGDACAMAMGPAGAYAGASNGFYYQKRKICSSFLNNFVHGEYTNFSGWTGPNINQRIFQYNTERLGIPIGFADVGLFEDYRRIAFPGLLYNCDGTCLGGNWFIPPGNILPFGDVHPDDSGAVPVSGLPENYELEYAPLAPLPFPGLDGGGTPNLATYLQGIFRMLLIVAVVLSVIMIVIAGFQYVSSSANPQGKGDARKRLSGALIGLVLALGSWLLLDTVNRNFASNLSITIPKVSLAGDTDVQPSSFTGGTTAFTIQQSDLSGLDLYCPLSGGVDVVPEIINSFEGKVTYRYGGKGGHLPVSQSFAASPGEVSGGAYMCTDESGNQTACRNFCPTNSLCLDCSGFVNHVLRCAGLSYVSGGTSTMVNNPQAISIDMNTLNNAGTTLSANGQIYELKPGDLLVYNGHVVMYSGNGNVAESRGALSDFQTANSNIQIRSLSGHPNKNSFTHLLKAS